jgi:Sigma-70 region 2
VREALRGVREPLGELLRRHWDTAVFLAARTLGSPELARDAAQEAAVAVMTDLERLRSPDRFGAWFCGITLNVSRRWLRQLRSEVPGLHLEQASPSTLITALYVKIDDELGGPRWVGRPPVLTDSELVCLAAAQALLGFTSEAHWLRYARKHLSGLFPYCRSSPGTISGCGPRSAWSPPRWPVPPADRRPR